MTAVPDSARLVKKVVIAYDLKALPPSLIRSLTLLRGKLARKGYKIEVVLRPLAQLPPDTDVLFAPAELLAAAQQAAPEAAWVAALDAATTRQGVFDELLQRLEAGQEIYALGIENGSGSVGSRGGVIVRYRGNERIG